MGTMTIDGAYASAAIFTAKTHTIEDYALSQLQMICDNPAAKDAKIRVMPPGVDVLEKARDFPKSGSILIITDAFIENGLKVKREHAYLIPKGARLPLTPKGKIFYFQE